MTNEEKRKHSRIDSVNLLNYVYFDENEDEENQGMGRTLNVSESGILLETHSPMDARRVVSLTIGFREDVIDIKGRVVYMRKKEDGMFESGIEFFDLNESSRRRPEEIYRGIQPEQERLIVVLWDFKTLRSEQIYSDDLEKGIDDPMVMETELEGLKLIKRGKVRDIYDMGDALLMVASDRISAFDVVMPQLIPDKGKILNLISMHWFDIMSELIPNHVIASDVASFPQKCQPHAELLADRSMLVKKAEPLPIECVVRGYISGSGWKSYQKSQSVCGIDLPGGLLESDRLPEPIFTPSTKEEVGVHDINIDFEEASRRVGKAMAEKGARALSGHL